MEGSRPRFGAYERLNLRAWGGGALQHHGHVLLIGSSARCLLLRLAGHMPLHTHHIPLLLHHWRASALRGGIWCVTSLPPPPHACAISPSRVSDSHEGKLVRQFQPALNALRHTQSQTLAKLAEGQQLIRAFIAKCLSNVEDTAVFLFGVTLSHVHGGSGGKFSAECARRQYRIVVGSNQATSAAGSTVRVVVARLPGAGEAAARPITSSDFDGIYAVTLYVDTETQFRSVAAAMEAGAGPFCNAPFLVRVSRGRVDCGCSLQRRAGQCCWMVYCVVHLICVESARATDASWTLRRSESRQWVTDFVAHSVLANCDFQLASRIHRAFARVRDPRGGFESGVPAALGANDEGSGMCAPEANGLDDVMVGDVQEGLPDLAALRSMASPTHLGKKQLLSTAAAAREMSRELDWFATSCTDNAFVPTVYLRNVAPIKADTLVQIAPFVEDGAGLPFLEALARSRRMSVVELLAMWGVCGLAPRSEGSGSGGGSEALAVALPDRHRGAAVTPSTTPGSGGPTTHGATRAAANPSGDISRAAAGPTSVTAPPVSTRGDGGTGAVAGDGGANGSSLVRGHSIAAGASSGSGGGGSSTVVVDVDGCVGDATAGGGPAARLGVPVLVVDDDLGLAPHPGPRVVRALDSLLGADWIIGEVRRQCTCALIAF